MRYLVPVPKQYVDESGVPCDAGSVSVYRNGTHEYANLYESSDSDELVENPSVLDSSGRWNAFVDPDIPLDYIVSDKKGNVIASYLNVMIDAASGESWVTKEYVDARDNEIRESVVEVSRAIEDERERAILSESEESAAREAGDAANAELIAEEKDERVAADNELENKIHQGDANNAAEIARVEANGLKIAPPEHEGVGTMLFYTGNLI